MVGAMRLPMQSPGDPELSEDRLISYLVKHQLRALGLSEAVVRKELQAIRKARTRQRVQVQVPDMLRDSLRRR